MNLLKMSLINQKKYFSIDTYNNIVYNVNGVKTLNTWGGKKMRNIKLWYDKIKVKKMTRHSWAVYVKVLLGILAAFGVILILGAIGKADYFTDTSCFDILRQMFWGVVCICPTALWVIIESRRWLD